MALSFVIPRVESRMILPDGTISRDWYMFLSALLQTVGGDVVVPGGAVATPGDLQSQIEEYAITSLEAVEALRGVDELRNEISRSLNQFNQLRDQIEDLAARVSEATANDLRNRIEAVESRLG